MGIRRLTRQAGWLVGGTLMIATLCAAWERHALADEITIEITAPDASGAVPFSMTCEVDRGGTIERARHEGSTPETLALTADAVFCELDSAGPLEVLARGRHGNVTRTRTSGGTIRLGLS